MDDGQGIGASGPRAILARFDVGVTVARAVLLGRISAGAFLLAALIVLVRVLVEPGWIPHFGQDFGASWIAAGLALDGQATLVFDDAEFFARQAQAFGADDVLLWHYPPTWHLLVTPFGTLPFAQALALYLLLSLGLWAAVTVGIQPVRPWPLFAAVALSGPVWMCLSQGQNGLLVGTALGAAFLGLRDGRVWLFAGGAALLLAKPHFGVLLPLVAVARGRWDFIVWAGVACAAFGLVATLAFGLVYWTALLDHAVALGEALSGGALWHQQVSVYAGLSALGTPAPAALGTQAAVAASAAFLTWRIWRSPATSWSLRGAALLVATPMISPYAFHYDLPGVALAIALIAREGTARGFLPGERGLGALLWFGPLYHWPLAQALHLPVLQLLLLAALGLLWQRYRHETGD